jgi:hypothetical protein
MTPGARGQVEALRRIRIPHPNDILCGRGGSINSHPGNKTYRTWVHERKNNYNLALSKAEKALISREIINLVQAQDPPGRFLTKDPDPSPLMGKVVWWVEIDDVKAMAKTSQALREGAPAIRAIHKHEIDETQKESVSLRKKSPRKAHLEEDESMPPPSDVPMSFHSDDLAIEVLRTAAEAAKHGMGQGGHVAPFLSNEIFEQSYNRPSKLARIDSTPTPPPEELESPPLMPAAREEDPKSFPSLSTFSSMKRAHSLSLSEVDSCDMGEEFVNPFEDESDFTNGHIYKYHIPSLARSSANSTSNSVGNMSFGSLFKSSSEHATSHQQRNGNNNGTPDIRKNVSSRSVSVDDTGSFSLFKNCFCECATPSEGGKVCPCSALADHLAWRDDHIAMDDWLHNSGSHDQIVPCDQSRSVSP